MTVSGINWVSSHRYPGVYSGKLVQLQSLIHCNKAGFYKAFNAIYGQVGRSASEKVLFALLKSVCR